MYTNVMFCSDFMALLEQHNVTFSSYIYEVITFLTLKRDYMCDQNNYRHVMFEVFLSQEI